MITRATILNVYVLYQVLLLLLLLLKEVIGDALNLESKESVGAAAAVIELSLCVMSVKLSSSQVVKDLID